jgi:hypothetical protein
MLSDKFGGILSAESGSSVDRRTQLITLASMYLTSGNQNCLQ